MLSSFEIANGVYTAAVTFMRVHVAPTDENIIIFNSNTRHGGWSDRVQHERREGYCAGLSNPRRAPRHSR